MSQVRNPGYILFDFMEVVGFPIALPNGDLLTKVQFIVCFYHSLKCSVYLFLNSCNILPVSLLFDDI